MTVEEFEKLCLDHDWYYEYSDDHRVWTQGKNQRTAIWEAYSDLIGKGLKAEADEIMDRYSPNER